MLSPAFQALINEGGVCGSAASLDKRQAVPIFHKSLSHRVCLLRLYTQKEFIHKI